MKFYKIGNAPYCFPVSKEEYFARHEIDADGKEVIIEADTHSYIEITKAEFKRLEKALHDARK